MSFANDFSVLADRCRRHIREGQINQYSTCLKEMARLMRREARYIEELSLLISAFYIDLSGFARAPYIDKNIPNQINGAAFAASLGPQQVLELFNKVVQPDMIQKHAMSIDESVYIFKLCIEGKVEKAEYILAQI